MSRTVSNTVEYFPHLAKPGKTIFILKNRFGNNGYAFWFQLLEVLSQSENHYYDCRNPELWQYLLSFCGSNEITGTEILDLLAILGNIDEELWKERIIWCSALVENLANVYKKRGRPLPLKPIIDNRNAIPDNKKVITGTEMPQSKVKESKVNKTKGESDTENASAFGEFKNVKLTPEEYQKLVTRFGAQGADDWIAELSLAKASKGYKTKSDYATILAWERRDAKRGGDNGRHGINRQSSIGADRAFPTKYTRPEDYRHNE